MFYTYRPVVIITVVMGEGGGTNCSTSRMYSIIKEQGKKDFTIRANNCTVILETVLAVWH